MTGQLPSGTAVTGRCTLVMVPERGGGYTLVVVLGGVYLPYYTLGYPPRVHPASVMHDTVVSMADSGDAVLRDET